jgi:hypothetical protein
MNRIPGIQATDKAIKAMIASGESFILRGNEEQIRLND